jgi:hypothetical protein
VEGLVQVMVVNNDSMNEFGWKNGLIVSVSFWGGMKKRQAVGRAATSKHIDVCSMWC